MLESPKETEDIYEKGIEKQSREKKNLSQTVDNDYKTLKVLF